MLNHHDMKKTLRHFSFVLLFIIVGTNIAYSQYINPKVKEMYCESIKRITLTDSLRINVFNDLIENRIKIIESPFDDREKYIKLSSVSLLNKYNPALVRDEFFDINTFNPLKYNLNFFSSKTEVYRIDRTNYVIVIVPQLSK